MFLHKLYNMFHRTCWIVAWRNQICSDAQSEYSVPAYCKEGLSPLEDLLKAMACYDAMHGESTTMRAFSSKCFHDTKYFERNVRDLFLRIAQKYDVGLSQISAQESLGTREQLAYLGIYARPELYELAGDIVVHTKNGSIHFSAATHEESFCDVLASVTAAAGKFQLFQQVNVFAFHLTAFLRSLTSSTTSSI